MSDYVRKGEGGNSIVDKKIELRAYVKQPLGDFGISEREPVPERTPAQIAELKERIGLIARVFSRTYDMAVYPSPGGGWACGIDESFITTLDQFIRGEIDSLDGIPPEKLQPKKIYYDVKDLEGGMHEEEIMGVMRHEIGHAKNTDYRLLFEGQRFARDDGYLPSSWAGAWNACEDPWVNNKEIGDSEVVREKMTALYRKWLPEVVSKINTQPVTQQLGLNIIHYWLTGESIPTLTDQKVQEIFAIIKPAVDEYFAAETAAETHEIFKTKIWDHYKQLEKKAKSDEEIKEMMRQMSGSKLGKEPKSSGGQGEKQTQPGKGQEQAGQGGSQDGEQGEGQEQARGKTPAEKEADGGMMSKLRRMFGFGKSKPESGKSGQPSSEQSQDTQNQGQSQPQPPSQAQPGAGTGLSEEVTKEMQRQQQQLAEKNKELEQDGKPSGEIPDDIDLSQVTPDLLKKLQDEIDKLTPEERRDLEKQAREMLDKKQAEAANKKLPKTIQMKKDEKTGEYVPEVARPDSNRKNEAVKQAVDSFNEAQDQAVEAGRVAEALAEAERVAEEEAKRKVEAERQAMARDGFGPDEAGLYRRFKTLEQSMEGQINNFMRVMEHYLPKKQVTAYGGEATYIGHKVSERDVVRRAPIGDYRVRLRREIVESEEPRLFITLLIDNSGSMRGQKMDESLKTAIFLARVLKRFTIPCAIKFFGDHVDTAMKFGDDYDDPKKKIKPSILQKGDASGNHTDMSSSLLETMTEMTAAKREFVDCHGAVFIISDSGANAGPMTGDTLGAYIEEKQKTFSILNFLLSHNTTEVADAENLFGAGNVIHSGDFNNLPAEAFKVLRIVLERILKTLRSS